MCAFDQDDGSAHARWSPADARPTPADDAPAPRHVARAERIVWVLSAVIDDLRSGHAPPTVDLLERALALLAAIDPAGAATATTRSCGRDDEDGPDHLRRPRGGAASD